MDKLDFLFGDASRHQLVPNIVVDVEGARLGCGKVTENQLGGAVFFGPLPNLKDAVHTGIYLAVGIVG